MHCSTKNQNFPLNLSSIASIRRGRSNRGVSEVDNNQDENCHATSNQFHGSGAQTEDAMIEKVD